jgi:hypothetical protein
MKRKLWGKKFRSDLSGLQHVFKKWVEHYKKCIVCQGRYFEKRWSLHLHKVLTGSNKVSLIKHPSFIWLYLLNFVVKYKFFSFHLFCECFVSFPWNRIYCKPRKWTCTQNWKSTVQQL